MARVFLDSGVFVEGISAEWGAAKGILILGCYGVLALETSEVVSVEVTRVLGRKGIPTGARSAFAKLVQTIGLIIHPRPLEGDIREGIQQYLPLMRHRADIPVLVAAIAAKPDWLVSSNPSHFNAEVARASGLRIVTPAQLMRYLSVSEVPQRP